MATELAVLKFAQILFDSNWVRDKWTAQPSHVVRYIAKKAGAQVRIGRILPPNNLVDVTFTCEAKAEAWVVDDVVHVPFVVKRPNRDGPSKLPSRAGR